MGCSKYRDLSAPLVSGGTAVAAVVGSTVSSITGGKFANEALTAALVSLVSRPTQAG